MISWPRNKYEWQETLGTALICAGAFLAMPTTLAGLGIGFIAWTYNKSVATRTEDNILAHVNHHPTTNETATQLTQKLSKNAHIPEPEIFFYTELYGSTASTLYDNILVQEDKFSEQSNLDLDEQEAVLAHEISHVKGRDTYKTLWEQYFVTFSIWSSIGNLSTYTATEIGIRATALLGIFALSKHNIRLREFSANCEAAKMMGSPEPLIKYSQRKKREAETTSQNVPKSTGKLNGTFNRLADASLKKINAFLFNTHPSLEDRIKRLEAMKLPHPDNHKPNQQIKSADISLA